VHDDHTLVRLEKKGSKRHSPVFSVFDKMHEHRNAMADEQGKKGREQALERRVFCAEKRKNKCRMPECEYPEVHDEKTDQKKSLVGLLPLGFSLCQSHFDDIVKTDDHVLGPVQNQDGRDTPAEKHRADKGNEIRENQRPDGYPEHRLYGSLIGVLGQEIPVA